LFFSSVASALVGYMAYGIIHAPGAVMGAGKWLRERREQKAWIEAKNKEYMAEGFPLIQCGVDWSGVAKASCNVALIMVAIAAILAVCGLFGYAIWHISC
jgi:hypothetical protein